MQAKSPGSPRSRYQNRGSDHRVGEVLRQGFERRAGDRGRVEAPRVAAHDVRHRGAGLGDALLETPGDGADVIVEAPEGDEGARGERFEEEAGGQRGGQRVDDRPGARRGEAHPEHHRAAAPEARGIGQRGVVEARFEALDRAPHDRDGMRYLPVQRRGVADHGVRREGGKGEQEGIEERHEAGRRAGRPGGCYPLARSPGALLPERRIQRFSSWLPRSATRGGAGDCRQLPCTRPLRGPK